MSLFCRSVSVLKSCSNLTYQFHRSFIVNAVKRSERSSVVSFVSGTRSDVTVPIEPDSDINILSPGSGNYVDFSDFGPEMVPTFNLAAYANRSLALQKLIDLGVDLAKLDKRQGIPQIILGLEFEYIKKYIQFLTDIGVPVEVLGKFFTKNPLIFKEDLDDLSTRVEYLRAKKYSEQMISQIITDNPFWLLFSTQRMEKRMDFFKEHFSLWSDKMLQKLVCSGPRLITYNLWHIRVNSMSVDEEMGFNDTEKRRMVLNCPKIWMIKNTTLVDRFNVVHTEMQVPHDVISRQPTVLLCRADRIRQRHLFLSSRGLAQYDPTLPQYISLQTLVKGNDAEFALDVAGSSLAMYSDFLKTL